MKTQRITLQTMSIATALVAMSALGVQVTRGPYLQMGTTNAMTVRWRTDSTTNSAVRYGPAPNALWFTNSSPNVVSNHEIRLTGLDTATRYYYAVGTSSGTLVGNDTNHFFQTAPPIGHASPTRIWVLGDSGWNDWPSQWVRNEYYAYASNRHTDVWLMLGDNAYDFGTDAEYQTGLFDLYPDTLRQTPLWPAVGDTEVRNGYTYSISNSGPYFDIFTLPTNGAAGGVPSGTEAYYSFDYADIHFVCLNSVDIDRGTNAAMMAWYTNDLAMTTQKWLIAFWHHAPYTKGSHDSDDELDNGGRMHDMRERFVPPFEARGGVLALAGNSHGYERSHLMNGHYGESDTLNTNTMFVDGGDGQVNGDGAYVSGTPAQSGTVHVVCGSSALISSVEFGHPAIHHAEARHGSMVITIESNQMDVIFLDRVGVVRDHFSIVHAFPDDDHDGLNDTWELTWFGDLTQTGTGDFDRDGLSNALEAEREDDPTGRAAPPWWSTRNVINTNASTQDFAALNAGQLKWIASNAFDEISVSLAGGAGTNVSALINAFSSGNNFHAINLGQLKAVALPFYDRLKAEGLADATPWDNANTTNHFGAANIGQAKHIFSFSVAN